MSSARLTQDRLQKLLDYNPVSGELVWRSRCAEDFPKAKNAISYAKSWNSRFAGKLAGAQSSENRLQIYVDGKNYNSHRVIWILVHGPLQPGEDVDHVNGDASDNRLVNLRKATRSQNNANRHVLSARNTSGKLGVSYDKKNRRWIAQIKFRGNYKFLGRFHTKEQAHEAYVQAKAAAFGEFAKSPKERPDAKNSV